MQRFKMDLSNPNNRFVRMSAPILQSSSGHPFQPAAKMPTGLNSPMIDRVYKARPGCSACGKKVA